MKRVGSSNILQSNMSVRKVVFVRHGESQGNAAAVFTGWGDTPLSVRGEQEATEAGLCLRAHGVKFDCVYTSVLPRATKTTETLLNHADDASAPIVKNWRLNARHSGKLQGLTQAEAVAQFGEDKVTVWRTSYDKCGTVAEDDPRHPFNDSTYDDVPREELPPGGESLKNVVDRVVPYWLSEIVPRVKSGENLLIVAHKNSFRALWKYIEGINDDDALDSKMAPASAPLIYEFEDAADESSLKFKTKYIMNSPHFNPKYKPGTRSFGKVYLIRHGESVNNAHGIDNGWEDTALTLRGERQAVDAGLCLKEKGIKIDVIFTSVLQRAVRTAEHVCITSNNAFGVPVIKSWRLNARHSGALHGLQKEEAVDMFGEAAAVFRTTPGAPPAYLERNDPRHPANDPLYAGVSPMSLPRGESYEMMANRLLPFWDEDIMPHIKAGKSVLIVAHRNVLKAILEHVNDSSKKGSYDAQVRSTLPYAVEFISNEGDSEFAVPDILTQYPLSAFAPLFTPVRNNALGKAVFLRHGESECNLNGTFTGWEDSGLTPKGERQANDAGRCLKDEGFQFNVIFTSYLSRAVESAERIIREAELSDVPVVKSWRLNARHPGVLQGLKKPEAIKLFGEQKVNLWRSSFDLVPDTVPLDDPRHPASDPLYAAIPESELPPGGESLARVVDRISVFWRDEVQPRILKGENVLLVGHKNSSKALFMYLEDIAERELFDVKPVSAVNPLIFEFGDSGLGSGIAVVAKHWLKPHEAPVSPAKGDGYDLGLARQDST